MQINRIEQQIETYTSSLAHAVNEGRGAQFSMLLSLINTSEYLANKNAGRSGGEFSLPDEGLQYPDPDTLYDSEVVARLNRSVSQDMRGDLAYLLSHIDNRAMTPENENLSADYFARVGLASAGRIMNDEIERSAQQFSAVA